MKAIVKVKLQPIRARLQNACKALHAQNMWKLLKEWWLLLWNFLSGIECRCLYQKATYFWEKNTSYT